MTHLRCGEHGCKSESLPVLLTLFRRTKDVRVQIDEFDEDRDLQSLILVPSCAFCLFGDVARLQGSKKEEICEDGNVLGWQCSEESSLLRLVEDVRVPNRHSCDCWHSLDGKHVRVQKRRQLRGFTP